ncbi:RcnB family protein [Sphingomonas sp. FW199]|uniref:RcnB family protein n=1 Tax=Sphingomonas sp. FW199 TaxID=3400217 RepID=UPI003CF08C0B
MPRDRNDDRGWDRNGNWGRNYGDWRDNQRYRQGWDDRRGWNRGWSRDNRYNWRWYRERNRQAYRLPRYYAPQGWGYGYRRFSVGITLGSFLFAPNYWINDPFSYRLPPAYGAFRWVRYYDDALLVDLRTGQVVDVVYDIFW